MGKNRKQQHSSWHLFFPHLSPLLKLLSEKLSVKNKLLFTWFVNARSYKMVYVQDTQLKR